ncbi:Clp protease N-terminal domain-containing protein [Streptomyces sp. NBC_00370]|uniref:Clp protease N-terminal domain-containing protein n=1 Tax=Streptomyces sp. NBC_00370 TaxID=2975728 RepID=UPI002E25FBE7
MPKINVYLPDDLAEAVKDAGVPVSAVCQRALEQAVRRVTAIRETVLSGLDIEEPVGALSHFTSRTRTVLKLAVADARSSGEQVGTGHLLAAVLAEGGNLALQVLRAMEIPPTQVTRDLGLRRAGTAQDGRAGDGGDPQLSVEAAAALELTVTEATSLGHNYVGCEHLLLGLAAEPDGTAGQVLRGLGAEPRLVRRAVTAALAGYVHLRAQVTSQEGAAAPAAGQQALAAAVRREIQPLTERIGRLEEHLGLGEAR